jgi:hypothetical protein
LFSYPSRIGTVLHCMHRVLQGRMERTHTAMMSAIHRDGPRNGVGEQPRVWAYSHHGLARQARAMLLLWRTASTVLCPTASPCPVHHKMRQASTGGLYFVFPVTAPVGITNHLPAPLPPRLDSRATCDGRYVAAPQPRRQGPQRVTQRPSRIPWAGQTDADHPFLPIARNGTCEHFGNGNVDALIPSLAWQI